MTKIIQKLYVHTPHGMRSHGNLAESNGVTFFLRFVKPDVDKMRMFDAYSIHPEALKEVKEKGATYLVFVEPEKDDKPEVKLKLPIADLDDMLSGKLKDLQNRVLAWQAEFAGGPTIYIKMTAFNDEYRSL